MRLLTHRSLNPSRFAALTPSSTIAANDRLQALRAAGKDVLSFNVGEPDFPSPPPAVEAARKSLAQGYTKYAPSMGLPALRSALCEHLRDNNGLELNPDQVLVTPAKFGVFATILALIGEGDEVLLSDPSWVSYVPIIQLAGGTPVFVKTRTSGFVLDPADVEAAISPRTRLLILNSPHNPTGAMVSLRHLEQLADIAQRKDLWVLSDEIYERIAYDSVHHSIAALGGMAERTLTVSGFSKSYAMTGWRIGWLTGPAKMVARLGALHQHALTCLPAFVQAGALAVLQDPAAAQYQKDMVATLRQRRDLLVSGLQRIEGFACKAPAGAFYVFPETSFVLRGTALADHLLEAANVAVAPGISFGPTREDHIRLSYACSSGVIADGLDRIAEAMVGADLQPRPAEATATS